MNTLMVLSMLLMANLHAQENTEKIMERKVFNPWTWQNERQYVQAVEVKNPESTLYISGQTAIDTNGVSSTANFANQLLLTIANLEEVIANADYRNADITRITVYTVSFDELGQNFNIIQDWIAENDMKIAVTVVEVSKLFETTLVEMEAIAVKWDIKVFLSVDMVNVRW